jgi:hypothetical protein
MYKGVVKIVCLDNSNDHSTNKKRCKDTDCGSKPQRQSKRICCKNERNSEDFVWMIWLLRIKSD